MYSIPLFLLNNENNIITRADIHNHQNFCKLFLKAESSYESKLEESKPKNLKKRKKKTKIYLQKYGHGSRIYLLIKNFRYAQ